MTYKIFVVYKTTKKNSCRAEVTVIAPDPLTAILEAKKEVRRLEPSAIVNFLGYLPVDKEDVTIKQ